MQPEGYSLSRFLSVELSQLGLLVACGHYRSLLQRLSRWLKCSANAAALASPCACYEQSWALYKCLMGEAI